MRSRTRKALALGCLATVAAADLTLRRRKPPWIVVGLFDHPAHLATGALIALNVPGRPKRWRRACLAGSLIADVDHIPLALRAQLPTTDDPRPAQPLPAGGRARGGRRRRHPERAPARAGRRHARPLRCATWASAAGVPLLWPLTSRSLNVPYAVYLAACVALVARAAQTLPDGPGFR